MSGGRSIDKERKSPRESGEDSEDESEILEESPCGRWLKRREEGLCIMVFVVFSEQVLYAAGLMRRRRVPAY
ncbi:Nuclear receptor-binding protein-like [Papilio machaon]|uniref:Nuclear receptor-binding protein-like n=1 Tax=Papilio machaon TaxID=76193 RepID=A0A0N1I5G5_PAPMA|nr:Nuclear receptor-binding protein-like [Papilio machaon]